MARAKNVNARYREIEKSVVLTVISAARHDYGPGPDCRQQRMVFHCHMFREPNRPIRDMCKPCAIAAAGSEEKIWVRSEEPTRRKWRTGERLPKRCSAHPDATPTRSSPGAD